MQKHLRCACSAAIMLVFAAAPAWPQQAGQPPKPPAAKAQKQAKPLVAGTINVNTATAGQLAMLPGVSMKKAEAFIDIRTKQGSFKDMQDLQKKTGLKQKKIDKIKEYIIFEGETTLHQKK